MSNLINRFESQDIENQKEETRKKGWQIPTFDGMTGFVGQMGRRGTPADPSFGMTVWSMIRGNTEVEINFKINE